MSYEDIKINFEAFRKQLWDAMDTSNRKSTLPARMPGQAFESWSAGRMIELEEARWQFQRAAEICTHMIVLVKNERERMAMQKDAADQQAGSSKKGGLQATYTNAAGPVELLPPPTAPATALIVQELTKCIRFEARKSYRAREKLSELRGLIEEGSVGSHPSQCDTFTNAVELVDELMEDLE